MPARAHYRNGLNMSPQFSKGTRDMSLRPENFPIGSPESRAATRAMLKHCMGEVMRVVIEHIGAPQLDRVLLIPLKEKMR
jgi:hypothetical protein